MSPEWTPLSRIGDNPLVWLVSVDGFLVDIRTMPWALQETAFAKSLIPD